MYLFLLLCCCILWPSLLESSKLRETGSKFNPRKGKNQQSHNYHDHHHHRHPNRHSLQQKSMFATSQLMVSVYYEALCRDSRDFIMKQLYPTYQHLGSLMLVDFVPYGKANHSWDPNTDNFWMSCQHGPKECYCNVIQACVLSSLTSNKDQVEYVNCVMERVNTHYMSQLCARAMGVTEKQIKECARGRKGHHLLDVYGTRTHALHPTSNFVPTITINYQYDDYVQNLSMDSFLSVICRSLRSFHPSACYQRKSQRRKHKRKLNKHTQDKRA